MADLHIYFHPRSPYSRLGLHRVLKDKLHEQAPATVHVFTAPAGGAQFLNPTDSKPKLAYIMEDAPRMTMRAGLPIAPPLRPEPDYAASITAFYAAREAGFGLPFATEISDARWGRSEDIADPEVLRVCAERAGVPASADLTEAPHGAMEEDQEAVEADGVFGVPFAALRTNSRTEKFWGQDRFALISDSLA